ncbi:MAG: MFS transporter [Bacteroidales bacterium]|uniref:MFS transporter n=1 Tax=Acidithiobacillus thiooxidans ATCC 19377 TaxID=637390 RepID=A0A543PYX3_ACITH|nr:MFS transporter [Acidithiobacillus thiooxidans]MDX5936841.1 MFS transporter [Acidithiobacillus thiooxidans]MDX5936883.1 MFS transporter [Acidithiobacillus thiooxidans]TQN49272.1 hypothetical protein DLNHIDIE_03452 [Acidithiobacillus thiooxidans ATCC 19377]
MKFSVPHPPSRRLLPASPGWRRLFVVRLFLKSYFFVPYLVLYAEHLGFSLGLLLTVEAVFCILIVVFDLPAGHLADRIGPRQALLAGAFLEGVASLLLGGLANQAIFWIVQPFFAAAAALTQGADAGLAGLILRHDKALEDFEQGEQLFQKLALVWTAAVYGLASALSLVSLQLPFIATGIAQLLCVVGLFTVPNLRRTSTFPADLGDDRRSLRRRAADMITVIHTSAGLRMDLLAMVAAGTGFSVLLYFLPFFLIASGSSASAVGVLLAVVALAAALVVHGLRPGLDLRVVGAIAVIAAILLGVTVLPIVVIAAICLQAVKARLLPRFRQRLLREMSECGEATAMSVVSTTTTIGFAVVAPALGVLTSVLSLTGLAAVTGALFLFATLTMSIHLRYGRSLHEPF